MRDGPFASMSRETKDTRPRIVGIHESVAHHYECDECGGLLLQGDWPFCRGLGHEDDHRR